MKACEVAEEKKRKRAMSGPSRGSSSGAPPKYRMIAAQDSSSNSTTVLRQHSSSSSRWQLGHHNSLHLLVTRATTVGKSATSPRTVVSLSWVMHLVLQLLG
jgi:hypothetical protein